MQMEGFRVFSKDECRDSDMDATSHAAADLKISLEGLAQHLFGMYLSFLLPFTCNINIIKQKFESYKSPAIARCCGNAMGRYILSIH